jgi:hypothetical protein
LTWESFNVGLEPQPLQHAIVSIPGVNWKHRRNPNANMCREYGMMMDPSAHPQHMNVLNHLEYVWRRCENHLMWVWSLNHCNMTLFQFQVWPGNFALIHNMCHPELW